MKSLTGGWVEKVERLEKEVFVLLLCFLESERFSGGNLDKETAAAVSISLSVTQTILIVFYFRQTGKTKVFTNYSGNETAAVSPP